MSPAALLVALGLTTATPRVELMPLVHQGAVLALGDVTAGGIGGGVGLQLTLDGWLVAQADAAALWLAGRAWTTRLALGVQRDAAWAPAAWLALGALWGDRIEHIGADARRPPLPTWALGARVSALRFGGPSGLVSLLELGAGTDFGGTLWLELTLVQAGARW